MAAQLLTARSRERKGLGTVTERQEFRGSEATAAGWESRG